MQDNVCGAAKMPRPFSCPRSCARVRHHYPAELPILPGGVFCFLAYFPYYVFCELLLYGVMRSSKHAMFDGCSLPATRPFDGYPYDVVLTLPSIAEAQVLHYGLVGVPYLVAVVPIEWQ